MKRHLLPALAAALALAALPPTTRAQTAVPGTITYQGKVSDATGALIGASAPVNRVVTFRVYDAITGGNRVYSERQTVTIAAGEFNVLVGGGTAIDGETNTTAFSDVFSTSTRYLGVTVDDGDNNLANDPEISPRQQIVTMPYAFRAKVAEGVTAQAITTTMLANNAVTATQLADNTITTAKLGADVGKWTVNGGSMYRPTGNVGLGISNPGALLSLGSSLANIKLGLWDDGAGSFYGLGVQGNQMRFQVPGSSDRFSFLAGSGPSPTEVFTINGTGAVQVYSPPGFNDAKILLQHSGTGTTPQSGLAFIESNAGYIIQYANLPLHFGTNGTMRMSITAEGKVGINTQTPGALLSLGGGTVNTKFALWDDGVGGLYGFGMGGNQMRFHTMSAADRFSFLSDAAGTTEMFTIKGNGNVGVGISAPTAQLHVHSSSLDSRIQFTTPATGTTALADGLVVGTHPSYGFIWQYENLPLVLATNTTERVRINSDGKVGFNTADFLDSNFNLKAVASGPILKLTGTDSGAKFYFNADGSASKLGSGTTWTNVSDRRLKSDIAKLGGSLTQLLKLRGVTFRYQDEAKYGVGAQTGFIAQEVEEVFPDWIVTNAEGFKMIGSRGFEAHTVEALRELRTEKDTQIAQRDAKIAALEARVRDLETQTTARLAAIERRLNATAVTANSPR